MTYEYFPTGVCSMKINIDVDDATKTINEVKFIGGCAGNTLGISSLLIGMKVEDAIKKLKGIDCRGKGTSCPDQLAIGLEKILNENK